MPVFHNQLDRLVLSSSYTSLARVLDMQYTQTSKVTTILVKNLVVDLDLPGFSKALLKGRQIPKRRMKAKPSPE